MCCALLIPSRWQEGLNRTMIDALHLGVPIICSESGAPPGEGVIDEENGYVVKSNNALALAKKMLKLLEWGREDMEHCRKVSTKRFHERFSDDVLLKAWSQLFCKYALS